MKTLMGQEFYSPSSNFISLGWTKGINNIVPPKISQKLFSNTVKQWENVNRVFSFSLVWNCAHQESSHHVKIFHSYVLTSLQDFLYLHKEVRFENKTVFLFVDAWWTYGQHLGFIEDFT